MKEKRMEMLYYKLLEYISILESGYGLYDCLHNFVGMTNAEMKEAGYDLEEYYQPDRVGQLAAASDKRYFTLEMLESQAREAVEFIINEGMSKAPDGKWIQPFDGLQEQVGLGKEERMFFLRLIGGMLCERPEVADLCIGTDSFDMSFCPNSGQEQSDTVNVCRVSAQSAQVIL